MNKQFYIRFIQESINPKHVRVVSKIQALRVIEGLIKHETKLTIFEQLELIATIRTIRNNLVSSKI